MINQFRAQQLMHDEMHSKGKVLARSFRPIVHFVIPATEIESMHYYTFISDLLADFALFCDERNVNESRMMRIRSCDRPNEEGGIGCIYVGGCYISHCKMYFCDGEEQSKYHDPYHQHEVWRGVMFRDHADTNTEYNTAKVFLIGDHFEKFLVSQGVLFARINTPR